MSDEKNERSEREEKRPSKGKALFEQLLLSLDGEPPEGTEPAPPEAEPAPEEAPPAPDAGEESPAEEERPSEEESPEIISDEELRRILEGEPPAPPEEEAKLWPAHPIPAEEEEALAQIFKDEPASPDEGTKVFGGEPPKSEEPPAEEAPAEPEAAEEPTAEPQGEEEPEDGEDDGYEARDYRPFRRRRNYRTGCMGGIMYFAMIACISIILAAVLWLAANDVLSLNKKEVVAEITISEDFTIDQVARQLKDAGIINYPALFKFYSGFSHAEEQIEPGTYTISSKLDYRAIVTDLQEGAVTLSTVEVTITEGKTLLQTFELLEENGVCSVEDLMSCAAEFDFDYEFLEGLEPGDANRLEGYLFPDTYEFYENSSPERAIKKFLDNFKSKVTEEMFLTAAQMGRDFNEVLTVASLIEKEAASDAERSTISSVIYNRLASPDFPYLNIDATVLYALGEHKEKLTYEDLQIDSPYNTYLYQGLPPGPICSPGLTSIRAALGPEETNYYYYALQTDGLHAFFSSKYEFDQFINSSAFGG